MYEALDSFLNISTWYTRHYFDEERFFRALDQIVRNPEFNADRMGEYIAQRQSETLTEDALDRARADYVAAAWAVRSYLEAIGHIRRPST
jgi:hypothetical protein